MRTTNGIATRAWPIGTIHHDPRQSKGSSSNVISIPNPIVTADVAIGSISAVSSTLPPVVRRGDGERRQTADDDGEHDGDHHDRNDVTRASTGSTPMAMPGRTSVDPRLRQAPNE